MVAVLLGQWMVLGGVTGKYVELASGVGSRQLASFPKDGVYFTSTLWLRYEPHWSCKSTVMYILADERNNSLCSHSSSSTIAPIRYYLAAALPDLERGSWG
ncbi:hypothetical protein F5883DRAFT_558560 [Diaporthe sp. PMI_573]|nr:hypothetical protein F5883DRAFT_558560 [Diaporthaceae sp. PMI_573]